MEFDIINPIPSSKDNRCRACMTDEGNMVCLLNGHNLELFSKCTSLEIIQSDELPKYICSECFIKLEDVHQFRQKCLMSDLQLRSEILKSKSPSMKLEPLESIDIKDEVLPDDETSFSDENVNESIFSPLNSTQFHEYICDICNANFRRKSGLSSHMAKHVRATLCSNLTPTNLQSQRVKRSFFNCHFDNCNKSYSTSRGLRRHANNVHPKTDSDRILKPQNKSEKRERLFCPKCPKWFGVQEKLDGHIRRIHEGLKGYKCQLEMCGKEFNKLRTFRLHMDTFHSSKEIPMFKCDYDDCDKVYNLKESLRRHIEVIHFKKPVIKTHQNLICETCGKSCRNAYSLKVHGYSHNGDFPFACSRCTRKFESSYKLKIHIMKHLNIKNFVCPHCGLRKTTNRELQHHLNVHSDEKKFQCKECPQAFNTYSALNNHVRIHHKKYKPYTCSHCSQTFAKKGTMKNHEMTHTGEKPYVCHCGHRFIQAVSLRLHLKVHANQSKSTRSNEKETTVTEHQESK